MYGLRSAYVLPSFPRCRFAFSSDSHTFVRFFACVFLVLLLVGAPGEIQAAELVEVSVLDKDYLVVHISDGYVVHDEAGIDSAVDYLPVLNTTEAVDTNNWTITSAGDANFGGAGQHPSNCYRKTKLNGHAQQNWNNGIGDYDYENTYEHWIYLSLPDSLQQGVAYTLTIDAGTNSNDLSESFTFDIYTSRSEAVHVNLVGYAPDATHKAADLYHWMGNGGARNYSSFQGNTVYVYNVNTSEAHAAGSVAFWMSSGSDVFGRNLTGADVWNVDFSSFTTPGTYRLVVEGVGCSQNFEIADDIYKNPFVVSLRGYYYMRIGDANPLGLTPPPRTPRFIPGIDPVSTTVYLTSMHPFHENWDDMPCGDCWDAPNAWESYRLPGNPTNPNAWGGHSDAADWDRHLAHVANIYDLLLPFILTEGAISDDDTGISESGNYIPDIIDEARNEVDLWLRLRDGSGGYSHGLTNPNGANELYQAGPTAIAAWANAANAAMLADAYRVAGLTSLMNTYRDEAITAYTHAEGLADQMLDDYLNLDDGHLRGRDIKMMAAAFLYNVTGNTTWEDVVNTESVCASAPTELINSGRNQLWGTAAYLVTPQTVNYPTMQNNMKTQIIAEAKTDEANRIDSRPSRRGTDNGNAGFWRTAQNMDRTIIAHAVANSPTDIDHFRKALALEADWGLGRNPLNIVEMSTAHTPLASKRNYEEVYTSGWHDGVSGIHPGHTPYLNLATWSGMVMGTPSALYEESYPTNVQTSWPRGEAYFPSRWVWAHTEFTPRQTMRGKMALYGYLYGLAGGTPPANPTLTVTNTSIATGTGTVTSSPAGINCGGDCSQNYSNGTDVTLTADPDTGSNFAGWSGACFGTNLTCEVSMTNNRSVTATFEPEGLTYILTVSKGGSGDGTVTSIPTGINCGSTCSQAFLSGSTVALSAAADGDSTFTGWSGACSGTGACNVTMNAASSVTASFRSNTTTSAIIYDDALAPEWEDYSWGGTINFSGTSPVQSGTNAVNATLNQWGGFSPHKRSGSVDTSFGYEAVKFWVHGGTGSDKAFRFFSEGDSGSSPNVNFTAVVNTWTEITITLEQLGNPTSISRLNFQKTTATAGTVSFDQIRIEAAPPTSLFEDDFETGDTSEWSTTIP